MSDEKMWGSEPYEFLRDFCCICGKLGDNSLSIGNHSFCNFGCQVEYKMNVKPYSYWIMDLAWGMIKHDIWWNKFLSRITDHIRAKAPVR